MKAKRRKLKAPPADKVQPIKVEPPRKDNRPLWARRKASAVPEGVQLLAVDANGRRFQLKATLLPATDAEIEDQTGEKPCSECGGSGVTEHICDCDRCTCIEEDCLECDGEGTVWVYPEDLPGSGTLAGIFGTPGFGVPIVVATTTPKSSGRCPLDFIVEEIKRWGWKDCKAEYPAEVA